MKKSHREGTQKVAEVLDAGKDAAFLTLGDPTVYATSMYIHQRIAGMGYRTSIVSGVPSFCAAAAKLGVSLGEKQEQIHIIPASYDVEAAMQLPGTKIPHESRKKGCRLSDSASKNIMDGLQWWKIAAWQKNICG